MEITKLATQLATHLSHPRMCFPPSEQFSADISILTESILTLITIYLYGALAAAFFKILLWANLSRNAVSTRLLTNINKKTRALQITWTADSSWNSGTRFFSSHAWVNGESPKECIHSQPFPKDITSEKRSNKASPHCICISKQRCASTPLGPVATINFLKQHFIPGREVWKGTGHGSCLPPHF